MGTRTIIIRALTDPRKKYIHIWSFIISFSCEMNVYESIREHQDIEFMYKMRDFLLDTTYMHESWH